MVFGFFGFWTSTLAVAIAAGAVPIIIHLLNRRRFRIVKWAAMRFLLAAQRQNTRRLRLEQLILLALRVLLVLLVVAAMASVTPWAEAMWTYIWPEGAGFARLQNGRIHKIIVLDGSLSMAVKTESGKNAFERARDLAVQIVHDSAPGDAFNVLLVKDTPTWIVGEIAHDAGKVAREISLLRLPHGNASTPQALNMIAAKLAESPARFDAREVYFLTDMQKATWLASEGVAGAESRKTPAPATPSRDRQVIQELQNRARTIFVDVGRDGVNNLAVTDISVSAPFLTTGALIPVKATVQNFGHEVRQQLRVDLLAGRARSEGRDPPFTLRVVETQVINLQAGERRTVSFGHKFATPGTFALQVRIEPDDLDVDNSRTAIVAVKDTIPVLLVNGKSAVADRFDKATEYLRLALNPYPKGQSPRTAPLRPRVVSTTQFSDPADTNLIPYDCVFLCDVARLSANEIGRLESHLRRGGGVVVNLGERSAEHLELYNRLLAKNDQGILPAKLLGVQQAPPEHYFVLQAPDEAFLASPLKAFAADDDKASLRSVRFRSYVRARPAADAKLERLLTFMPEVQAGSKVATDKALPIDDPAILAWNPPLPAGRDEGRGAKGEGPEVGDAVPSPLGSRYRGKVVLVTSTLNMDWDTWPGSPSFAAMVQELTRYAVSGRLREHHSVVGEMLEEFLPGGVELTASVFTPGQEHAASQSTRSQAADDIQVFHWTETDQSGIYRMVVGQDPHEHLFAVHVPATTPGQRGSESDLARADRESLRNALGGLDFQVVRALDEVKHSGGPVNSAGPVVQNPIGPLIAHALLIAVLVILLMEVVLAWVFAHYTTLAGMATGEPVRTGAAWPGAVAVLAGLAFIAAAGVLLHAARTGDFLGFLPETFRGWIEALLGVPPPAPGEGTRWSLEFLPFLRDARSDPWLAGGIALAAATLVFAIYRLESHTAPAAYKVLLGSLRIFLILFVLAVLLPQLQLRFERQGWPDVVVLIDDSRSMGEPDSYQDEAVQDAANAHAEKIRKQIQARLPEKIKRLQTQLDEKLKPADTTPGAPHRADAEELARKIQVLQTQLTQANSPGWRPSRLQLAQALLSRPDPDWLQTLLHQRKMKVHVFHLDHTGRAIKLLSAQGTPADITDLAQPQQPGRALDAVLNLDPEGNDSRLGTAVHQVLDHYRGASLAGIVMITDGVTTKDETIGQVADYAAQKGVPLFFVGIGDNHEIRDLRLHDLQVADTVYVNDHVIFEARLTGNGYKDLTVPVVLKVKEADGSEREIKRELVRVDPQGKSVKIKFRYQPTEPGEKLFIVQVEVPRSDKEDKPASASNTRLQRTIFVQEARLIKVLYVEGSSRYEYRFVKNLLERESPDQKRNKTVEVKVVLIDSDEDFPKQDKSALSDFPFNKQELYQYDVVILGDVDPHSPKVGDARLRDLADFVRERGGGLLMIAGANFSPHAYRDTPLAAVLPVEPNPTPPAEPEERVDGYRLELTPAGRLHPIFRLSMDDAENLDLWSRLAPMYWWSEGYHTKPAAEVLAVHPRQRNEATGPRQPDRHPLVVQHFVGAGRCLFFGFDETWRWRFREDELIFNRFWTEVARYLARSRLSHTKLFLDRQTPFRVGEPIKVTVQFPDNAPLPGGPAGAGSGVKSDVKVIAEFKPQGHPDQATDTEVQALHLAKVEGSWATYEGLLTRTREGKYRFWLSSPDVSKQQPNGQKPSAEATVVQPPGELDRLRMNQQELTQAAEATHGRFYTLASADRVLDDLPAGTRVALNTPRPPLLLWNHWLCFLLVLSLLTSEWLLRKRKHLL
jgi:Aerotolerance regulator N-terminal/von Willebrand factor type A domain